MPRRQRLARSRRRRQMLGARRGPDLLRGVGIAKIEERAHDTTLLQVRSARRPSIALAAWACLVACTGWTEPTFAYGFAGKRFFPATLATDDPFVADELSLPTVSRRRTGDDASSSIDSSASVDFSKRVTNDFGVGFRATWLRLEPRNGVRVQGFDNFPVNAKY